MDQPEQDISKGKLTIITNQGSFEVYEDYLANIYRIYSSIFYRQSYFKQITYKHIIQYETYQFLTESFFKLDILYSDENEESRGIKRLDYEQLKEIYIFLAQWEIDGFLFK